MTLRRLKSFTLIELLVVVAIIALLVGILLPSLKKARDTAKATRCQANLHSIGQAIKAYMNDNNDYFPPMASVPTVEKTKPVNEQRKSMDEILAMFMSRQYVQGQRNEVFHCPCDQIMDPASMVSEGTTPGSAGNFKTYFEWQGSSYSPLPALAEYTKGKWSLSKDNHLSDTWNQLCTDNNMDASYIIAKLPVIFDYEAFHPKTNAGALAGRMVLFSDFHVEPGKDVFGVQAQP
jgi:prepilin-type N-terminal cleavage/methylation domain-containing protein